MSRRRELLDVVSIGGGTGLACLLSGLKLGVGSDARDAVRADRWIAGLTAIVTVTDDGGSSGRLRDEMGVPPPGDIRTCLVALSADESLMSQLFRYRFSGDGGLGGHSFGNLFLTALSNCSGGDFLRAIRLTSEVLAVRGRIFPSTLADVRLEATTESGVRLRGESSIARNADRIRRIRLSPRACRPIPPTLEAIRGADIITLGPGSLYTSLLPNLLVVGIADAIRRSPAIKIYVGNLMTQPGETTGYSTSEHVEAIERHAGGRLLDVVVLNRRPIPAPIRARYRRQGAVPVESDHARLRAMGLEVFEDDILAAGRVVRHDPALLAAAVRAAHARATAAPQPATDRRLTRAAQ